jgi:thiamine-phosphate pyrophosphorylase
MRTPQSAPNRKLDLRLYAIVDPQRAGGRDLADLASLVAGGGAVLVQLRDKHRDTRPMVEAARAIKARLKPLRVPLLINDRVDVALAAAADGVHLGQDDMAIPDARRLLSSGAIIGLSVKTVAQAEAAPVDLLDYAAIGGVFATTSKDNPEPPIGIEGLRLVAQVFRRRRPDLPLCAIAGIDAGNARTTIAAGVDGVAVISALSLAASPEMAACELRAIVDAALAARPRQ